MLLQDFLGRVHRGTRLVGVADLLDLRGGHRGQVIAPRLADVGQDGGDLLVGSFAHGQIGWNRPFAGAGNYRTPVPGLYLCGGSTHPGGNVTGLCGYNAARVIAADTAKPLWWNPPDIEAALASLPG